MSPLLAVKNRTVAEESKLDCGMLNGSSVERLITLHLPAKYFFLFRFPKIINAKSYFFCDYNYTADILKRILARRRQHYPPCLLLQKACSHVLLQYLLWEYLKPVLVHIVVFLMEGSYRSRLNLLADIKRCNRGIKQGVLTPVCFCLLL